LQKYFPLDDNTLNVVKKKFTREDKSVVNASHPPLEKILIDVKGVTVKASPFKLPKEDYPDHSKATIEQNNFVNQSLHTIGQQLDRIEERFSEETREGIRKAVKKGDDGFPIFNERVGMGEPDAVNTLIYTIIKHFIGTPSNITARISDVLNNLRCPTMSDYRWYQDVFHSRVMLKTDSDKPYWKEKFIDELPSLFAHKVKEELLNPTTGMIDYENLTYGEIFSTVKKLGIRMCIDQKLLRQQLKNSKKMKYEMGS
jgi:hypothetical protein